MILKQPCFYQKVFNIGCFCFSLLKKRKIFFIIVFNFVMASTAKCISGRRAQLIQEWIPSVLTLAAQPSPPQLYEVTGAPAGSKSDKHHLCFISFFLSLWITFCLKTRIFFPPWSLLEPLICSRIKYSFETSVLCQVKIGMTQDRYFLGEWGLIMIGISYLLCTPDGENGLRLDWEISLSNEKGGMNLYCPRSKLWPQLTRTRFYPLAWREKINSLEAVPPLCV